MGLIEIEQRLRRLLNRSDFGLPSEQLEDMKELVAAEQPVTYLVQSGVVGWEDPNPTVDWSRKTVTVCAGNTALLTLLLNEVLSSEVFSRKTLFRCNLSPLRSPRNTLQQRGLESALRRAAPGFKEAVVTFGDSFATAVAEIDRAQAIELGHLSSYRQTLLIAVDARVTQAEVSKALSGVTAPLDVRAISGLLATCSSFTVLRVLEEETQSVLQLVCDVPTSDSVALALDGMAVRQVSNRVAASQTTGAIPS